MGDSDHIHTRPRLVVERHMRFFETLTPLEVGRIIVRMQQDHVLAAGLKFPAERDGRWLFDLCSQLELDHASIVFPLAREADSIGVSALEKLIGHEITRVRPKYNPRGFAIAQAARREAIANGTAKPAPSGGFSPDQVILRVVPNPKKPGSATWHRFKLWVPGQTVAQCMQAGLTRADVLWDIDSGRRFVILGSREDWVRQERGDSCESGESGESGEGGAPRAEIPGREPDLFG